MTSLVYLQANFLLLLGCAAFSAVLALLQRGGRRLEFSAWVRLGQALLLFSLLFPLALHFRGSLHSVQPPVLKINSDTNPRRPQPARQLRLPLSPRQAFAEQRRLDHLAAAGQLLHAWRGDVRAEAALLLWIVGFLAWLFRFASGFRRLRAVLLRSILLHRIGRVRVAVSGEIQVPFSVLIGSARWVLLPEALLGRPADFRLALKHEIQHHRSGDTLWAVAMELLCCLFFCNPGIHLWRKRISELQEFSCDDALVGRRGVSLRDYGSCLVRVAETALGSREMYVGTTCMAAASRNPAYFKSFLRRRMEMLTSKTVHPANRWSAVALGTLLGLLVFSAGCGAEKLKNEIEAQAPNPGVAVVDPAIQRIADRAVAEAVKAEKASEGFAIVADPQTGRILAVANVDASGKKNGQWSLSMAMEPASVAKTIVAAEAIEEGKTNPTETHYCENGRYWYGGRPYHDWKDGGFERLTTTETIAMSSDICTIKIADRLGPEGVFQMLKRFGFGPGGTASTFPGARSGQLPPPADQSATWLVPYVSYGQGFRVTPLELVQAYGAIANGGDLLEPLPANADPSERRVVRRVLSPEHADQVRQILRQVVMKGTAREFGRSALYTTAGKTASSYVPDLSELDWVGGTKKSNLAGFLGFAPLNSPKIEVYVAIKDPESKGGAHGSSHAAPVFRRIVDEVLQEMKVAPETGTL
jgi:Penicillin binding protein transpeptidase domain/BlaR1 peptidase M56